MLMFDPEEAPVLSRLPSTEVSEEESGDDERLLRRHIIGAAAAGVGDVGSAHVVETSRRSRPPSIRIDSPKRLHSRQNSLSSIDLRRSLSSSVDQHAETEQLEEENLAGRSAERQRQHLPAAAEFVDVDEQPTTPAKKHVRFEDEQEGGKEGEDASEITLSFATASSNDEEEES
jgi:hypothetical protein